MGCCETPLPQIIKINPSIQRERNNSNNEGGEIELTLEPI